MNCGCNWACTCGATSRYQRERENIYGVDKEIVKLKEREEREEREEHNKRKISLDQLYRNKGW